MSKNKFSLREVLLVVTIVALAIPYVHTVLRQKRSSRGALITSSAVAAHVKQICPNAIYQRHANRFSGTDDGRMDCVYDIPAGEVDNFFARLIAEITRDVKSQGWTPKGGTGNSYAQGQLSDTSLLFERDGYLTDVGFYWLVREPSPTDVKELHDVDTERVRFVITYNTIGK